MNRRLHIWTCLLAWAGIVASHWLAFRLTVPDAHERARELEHTGHGYWSWAVVAACVAIIWALAIVVVRTAREPGSRVRTFSATVLSLAALQMAGFLGLEVGERLLSGTSVLAMLHEPAVIIGLPIQLLVALVGTIALAALVRAVDLVAALVVRQPVRRAELKQVPASAVVAPKLRVACGGATLRGPPGHLLAMSNHYN